MTGSYLLDLCVERPDILSTIHHCMGPALLLWMRTSSSTFTSSDALVCRILILFVFFGACIGGSASSGAIFLLRAGKRYLDRVTLYKYYALCLAVLTTSTVTSCFVSVLYISYWFTWSYSTFGNALLLPILWEGFECLLQWRWLFRYHEFESRFWQGATSSRNGPPSPSEKLGSTTVGSVTTGAEDIPVIAFGYDKSVFPSQTVSFLKFLVVIWSGIYVSLYVQIIAGCTPGLRIAVLEASTDQNLGVPDMRQYLMLAAQKS